MVLPSPSAQGQRLETFWVVAARMDEGCCGSLWVEAGDTAHQCREHPDHRGYLAHGGEEPLNSGGPAPLPPQPPLAQRKKPRGALETEEGSVQTPSIKSTDLLVRETGVSVSTLFAEGRIFPTEGSLVSVFWLYFRQTNHRFISA